MLGCVCVSVCGYSGTVGLAGEWLRVCTCLCVCPAVPAATRRECTGVSRSSPFPSPPCSPDRPLAASDSDSFASGAVCVCDTDGADTDACVCVCAGVGGCGCGCVCVSSCAAGELMGTTFSHPRSTLGGTTALQAHTYIHGYTHTH